MSSENITECAVAIFLDETELQELGLHIPVSAKQARTLITNAMLISGREPWCEMEVDMFTYDDSVLLLARPAEGAAQCFLFEDLEDLLGAVGCLPATAQSTLIWMDGGYYLFLGIHDIGHSGALYEFGRPVPFSDEHWAHIAEHGKILAANHAIFTLTRYFLKTQ